MAALINALTDDSDADAVAAVREAYENLTDDQKDLVSDEAKANLESQEKRIADEKAAAEKAEADQKAADAVVEDINKLTADSTEAEIAAARDAYNALTDEQKALVSDDAKAILETQEKRIEEEKAAAEKAEADQKAADSVVDTISKLSDTSTAEEVVAAKAAYNSLTDDQKAKVPEDVKAILETQEKRIEDEKAAENEADQTVQVSAIRTTGLSNKIAAGKKVKLTANILPENASNKAVKWTSSNTKIATVNGSGVVSIKKKTGGKTVIITATATDGSGVKAAFKIKSMKGVVKKITIKGAKKVKAGKSLKLKATVKASKGANKKLKWTSSNTKWATVNGSGKVVSKKAGKGKTVKITAMATDGSGKKKVVSVKIK